MSRYTLYNAINSGQLSSVARHHGSNFDLDPSLLPLRREQYAARFLIASPGPIRDVIALRFFWISGIFPVRVSAAMPRLGVSAMGSAVLAR
jgi:hypothetical protein